jgi:hypothetical protein
VKSDESAGGGNPAGIAVQTGEANFDRVIGEGEEDVEMCGGDGYASVMIEEDLREIVIDAESEV